MDMALAIQQVTEDIVLRLACTARQITGCKYLVLAGGVALNCVANGKLLRAGTFDDLWIQPAAGDAGGAVGAAYAVWHIHEGNERHLNGSGRDSMQGSYLGPEFSDKEIRRALQQTRRQSHHYDDFDKLAADVAAEAGRRKRRRLVPGPHGIWPARSGWTAASSAMPAIPRCRRS